MADTYFHKNLSWPLAIVTSVVALTIVVMVSLGKEARDVQMGEERHSPA
jgi:hypothetical protein